MIEDREHPKNVLVVRLLNRAPLWALARPLVDPRWGLVEPGFVTDFQSVPWLLRSLTLGKNQTAYESVFHDKWRRQASTLGQRLDADRRLQQIMLDRGHKPFWAWVYRRACYLSSIKQSVQQAWTGKNPRPLQFADVAGNIETLI